MSKVWALFELLVLASCSGLRLQVTTRRHVIGLGAAALVVPATPALAKSKKSLNPNKQDGVEIGSVARMQTAAKETAAMQGDKGSRGTEIAAGFTELEKKRVPKVANKTANRNRSPEELGLKAYGS